MEDISSTRNDLNTKLQRETTNLAALKESLATSQDQTHRMLDILDAFDSRLLDLEHTIMPIYQETGLLQRRQDNIKHVSDSLASVIGYYHVVNKAEPIISKGPSHDLPTYLNTLANLQTAVKFFFLTNPNGNEYATVVAQYEGAKSALEREFRTTLEKASKPLPPIIVLDCIDQDEEPGVDTPLPDQMSPSIIDQLSLIALWLQKCGIDSTHSLLYQKTRSKVIVDSLKSLTEHIKSSSLESTSNTSVLSNSPSLSSKIKTPTKDLSSTKRVLNRFNYLKKASDQLFQRISNIDNTGQNTQTETKHSNIDIGLYITTVQAFIKLIQSEKKMMTGIISEGNIRKVFNRIIQAGLEIIFSEGENIASVIKKKATQNDHTCVVALFPVLKFLRQSKSTYERTLEGYPAPTRTKVASLIASLDYNGVIVLEQYVDCVKNDTSSMPKDGTVHELTSNTIIFMEQLMQFADTAGSMLLTQDPTSLQNTQNTKRPKLKLAEYINKILRSLSDNLTMKSDTITDLTLRSIFMLNNYNHILKALKSSGLLSLVNEWNDTIVRFFDNNILDQKRVYSRSWTGVYNFIKEDKTININKIKDKDRQLIKDKFTGFNREFEDLHRIQRTYAIPDAELRDQIRRDNVQLIKPKYYEFLRLYIPLNFTKNLNKYKKYTDAQIETLIMEFFESS